MPLRLAASALLLTAALAQAQVAPTTPVIEAVGLSITKAEFEALFEGDQRFIRGKTQPEVRLGLGNEAGKAFALEAEARNRKIEQLPSVQLKLRNYTTQLLAQELLVSTRQAYLKDEAALKAQYEKDRQVFEEPQVRQILVRFKGSEAPAPKGRPELNREQARARAEALLAKLSKGADFEALAKAESDDTDAKRSGGDLGFVRRAVTDATFEEAAYALPVGAISAVISTKFGFHILRVESRRPMPFELVKVVLANTLAHRDLDAIVMNGYKLNMAYFGK